MNKLLSHYLAVACIVIVSLLLGIHGYMTYYSGLGLSYDFSDAVYGALQLFPLNSGGTEPGKAPWSLSLARFLAPLATVYAILASAALMGKTRLALYGLKGHALVCGFGYYGTILARYYADQGLRVAVMDADPSPSKEARARALGALLIRGDAVDASLLKKAGLSRAGVLAVTCGDDVVNMSVAATAAQCLAEKGGTNPLRCVVQTGSLYGETLDVILERLRTQTPALDPHVFDPDMAVAYNTLHDYPLDYKPIRADSPLRAQLVLVDWTHCAECLALATARLAHYANGLPARIVLFNVPPAARDALEARYPGAGLAAEFLFPDPPLESPAGMACLSELVAAPHMLTTIAFCAENPSTALNQALSLPLSLPLSGPLGVPMGVQGEEPRTLVRVRDARSGAPAGVLGGVLAGILAGTQHGQEHAPRVRLFGSYDTNLGISMRIDTLARLIHERYRERKLAAGERQEPGDKSILLWEDLPLNLKESNRQQALHLEIKARAIGCALVPAVEVPSEEPVTLTAEETETLAAMEHRRWVAEKSLAGWTFSARKDAGQRRSPYLLPYAELPEDIKQYNRDCAHLLPGQAARMGLVLCRRRDGSGAVS